jgi:hypothetical protein
MVGRILAVTLSAALGVGLGFVGHRFGPPLPPGFGPAGANGATAAPSADAAPAPSASAEPSASAASSAVAPPAIDVGACTRAMFPADAFPAGDSPVAFVCDEPSVVKGALRTKEAIVQSGGGHTTDGMKEWSTLGFYSLAAYAVTRDACCPGASPLDVPKTPDGCASMTDAIGKIVEVSKPGAADDDAVESALKAYTKAVKCVVKQSGDKTFGGFDPPSGGQQGVAKKTIDRARAPK